MSDDWKSVGGGHRADLDFDFTMAFQPIVDIAAGRVWGYEALVRGLRGESAVTILEQVNAGNCYRFDQACRVKAIEMAASLFPPGEQLKLSINFMPNAVYDPADGLKSSIAALDSAGMRREDVIFEFVEQPELSDTDHVADIVEEYRRQGFLTAIDDFGAGHAGLGTLAQYQPDMLKIDMELVRGIEASRPRQVIVAGIVAIARHLGIKVLAVGIESDDEIRVLRAAGIELMQGYYFAHPGFRSLPDVDLRMQAESLRASA